MSICIAYCLLLSPTVSYCLLLSSMQADLALLPARLLAALQQWVTNAQGGGTSAPHYAHSPATAPTGVFGFRCGGHRRLFLVSMHVGFCVSLPQVQDMMFFTA